MTALSDQSTFPAGAWWPVVAGCLAGAFAWRLVAALWWAGSRRVCDAQRAARAHKPDCVACLLYTSPSPRDRTRSRMPSSA